jgi:hypothetical protein
LWRGDCFFCIPYFLCISGHRDLLLLLLIVYSLSHLCIHCLSNLPHTLPLLPFPFLPSPLTFRPNLLCSLLQFCWREDISDNEKDKAFLLLWDKDSYAEKFLASFPCTRVLQPTLVHLYLTSSLLPGHLPIVASVTLLLYSLLYSGHINHFQVSGFLPFLYSSCMCSPLSVWSSGFRLQLSCVPSKYYLSSTT